MFLYSEVHVQLADRYFSEISDCIYNIQEKTVQPSDGTPAVDYVIIRAEVILLGLFGFSSHR